MKLLLSLSITLTLLTLSTSVFANERIVLKPGDPVSCSDDGYHRNVNWIKDVKVSHNEESVLISFNTQIGSCGNGKVNLKYLRDIGAKLISKENRGFRKKGFTVSKSSVDADIYQVSIKISKKIAFKNKSSHKYALHIKRYRSTFRWLLNLEQGKNGKVPTLKFM